MASRTTTQSIESKTKVWGNIEIFDFFFIGAYVAISYALSSIVHPKLRLIYMIFSVIMGIFLTARSSFNKNRRNYESLYFLFIKDSFTYRPFRMEGKDNA